MKVVQLGDSELGQNTPRNEKYMAIKKSDLYSKLWSSCDELRGGMDASQYKDYVLVLLFIKYVSDKYAGLPFAPIQIPEGASFADMIALKGKSDIGDQINKKIIRPLEEANRLRIKADFDDSSLLGAGKEKVEKLTNLIGIFESRDLDFSRHRADGDDILGDAYEYLMRHFATESGKSKGQFYTPAEVSRIMAQLLGIAQAKTSPLKNGRLHQEGVRNGIYEACKYFGLFNKTVFKNRCAVVTSYNPQASDVSKEETGANTESDKQFIYNIYTKLLKNVTARSGMNKTETYEQDAKERFIKAPAKMKLLIVVDKLLTGFDAPPCTYLYIDKSMQDHGLFQAICRTNRLDGEDKDFGYIVDYKDLFKKVEKAIAVYTAELDHSAGDANSEILMKDRLTAGRERLDDAVEALALLCEPVEPPKGDLQHIHHFCGNTEIADDLKAREPYRVTLYRAVVALVRAYANLADEMEAAGYENEQVEHIKALLKHYLNLREIIRKAAGETLDLKPYEADMRHLIDTYIEAQAPRKISPFDGIGLLDLIVKTGIADAIAERLGDMQGSRESIAETIENNVRSKILKEQLTDPAYFAKMSALLDEIIRLRKERAVEYEDYLSRIAEVAKKVAAGKSDDTPSQLKTAGQLALYNNLKEHVSANTVQQPEPSYGGMTKALYIALRLDAAIKTQRFDGWRGMVVKEQMVKQAMFDVLDDIKEVNRLFPIVFAQKEY